MSYRQTLAQGALKKDQPARLKKAAQGTLPTKLETGVLEVTLGKSFLPLGLSFFKKGGGSTGKLSDY